VVSVLNPPASAPAGCPVDLVAARSQLVDAVVESDDALMEKYLMEGSVSAEELTAALPKALAAGTVIPIFCTSAKKDVGVAALLEMQGSKHTTLPEAVPGDIFAVTKIEDLHIGDTVSNRAGAPKLPAAPFPTPMFGLAVEPKARGDEQKISGSLQKIANEDP